MNEKLSVNPEHQGFEQHLINIKNIFSQAEKSIHKARNELKIVELGGIRYVIKSFKVPHLINRIAYTFFRDGKARKSYLNALKLQALHVSTPEAVGVIEFFERGLLKESFFVSLYEPYDFTIREVFHHKVDDIENILKQFAKFSYELHQKGIWHVDFSLGNILITKRPEGYKFSLVDINRMEFRTIEGYEGLKNFNKFWAKDRNDLVVIAKAYASLAGLDEEKAINTVLEEAQKLEARVNLKRKLKSKS